MYAHERWWTLVTTFFAALVDVGGRRWTRVGAGDVGISNVQFASEWATVKSPCIFCGSELSGKRAKEHVFPQWLQREFDWDELFLTPTHFSGTGEVISSRAHDLGSFVEGHVCASCNNGWMSRLEVAARPVLVDLITAKREAYFLTEFEAFILARWTAKTCFCLHSASNYRRIVHPGHFKHLISEELSLPPNCFVYAHSFKSDPGFFWIQSSFWLVMETERALTESERELVTAKAYKIALRLGSLYLITSYMPLRFGKPVLDKYRHVPLYPSSGSVAWRLQTDPWPKDPMGRLAAFHGTLGYATGDV